MILAYSKSESLSVAVEKTFDGKHPCDDCRSIQQAKEHEKEKSDPAFQVEKKVEILVRGPVQEIAFPMPDSVWSCCDSILICGYANSPPVPPPRALFI